MYFTSRVTFTRESFSMQMVARESPSDEWNGSYKVVCPLRLQSGATNRRVGGSPPTSSCLSVLDRNTNVKSLLNKEGNFLLKVKVNVWYISLITYLHSYFCFLPISGPPHMGLQDTIIIKNECHLPVLWISTIITQLLQGKKKDKHYMYETANLRKSTIYLDKEWCCESISIW